MKADNPMLTAFALGELTSAEHAEIDQELQKDREVAAEVAETKEIARILRQGLAAEPVGELASHQRDAIFRELELIHKERSLTGGGPATTQAFAPMIVPRSGWWNRTGTWQAIAACTVVGFAGYALMVNVGPSRRNAGTQAGEFIVQVPTDGAGPSAGASGPDLVSPQAGVSPGEVAASGLNGLKAPSNPPKVIVQPSVPLDEKPIVTNPPPERAATPDGGAAASEPAPERPRRGPYVVDNKNPDVANNLAGASIARRGNKTTITEENVATFLKEQGLRAGSTYEDFLRLFRPVPNKPGWYELINAPSIQVEAHFTTPAGQPLTSPPNAESRVKQISKDYLN